jgi:hypothetical protein
MQNWHRLKVSLLGALGSSKAMSTQNQCVRLTSEFKKKLAAGSVKRLLPNKLLKLNTAYLLLKTIY